MGIESKVEPQFLNLHSIEQNVCVMDTIMKLQVGYFCMSFYPLADDGQRDLLEPDVTHTEKQ